MSFIFQSMPEATFQVEDSQVLYRARRRPPESHPLGGRLAQQGTVFLANLTSRARAIIGKMHWSLFQCGELTPVMAMANDSIGNPITGQLATSRMYAVRGQGMNAQPGVQGGRSEVRKPRRERGTLCATCHKAPAMNRDNLCSGCRDNVKKARNKRYESERKGDKIGNDLGRGENLPFLARLGRNRRKRVF